MAEEGTLTEKLFRAAVVLKRLNGAGQLLVGLVLIFVEPSLLTRLAYQLAEHFAGGTRTFVLGYLLLHGVSRLRWSSPCCARSARPIRSLC